MWDKFNQEQAFERQQLLRLLASLAALASAVEKRAPTEIELLALGAMLQSFYNGVETILKRGVIAAGQGIPRGENWHRDLLQAAASPIAGGSPLISAATKASLLPYLAFRHMARQAYGFELDWEKMRPLVSGCGDAFRRLEEDIDAFLSRPSGLNDARE